MSYFNACDIMIFFFASDHKSIFGDLCGHLALKEPDSEVHVGLHVVD